MNNLVITILAAGEGKRMNSVIPKVLHTINGTPMLVKIILQSIPLNPSHIIIVVGKFELLIKNCLKNYFNLDLFTFINQPEQLGTGNAILCCLPFLNSINPNSHILVLNGDVPLITSFTLCNFISDNKNSNAIITTLLENPFGYGRILTINNNVCTIIEEKDCNHSQKLINEANCGIYLFNLHDLIKYLPQISNNNQQHEYYLTDIVKIMYNENIIVNRFIINKQNQYQILGINTPEQLAFVENLASSPPSPY